MPTKEEKRAELEAEYAKHLEEIEAEGDTPDNQIDDEDDDIIILKGNAKKEFLASLMATGMSEKEAEKEVKEVEKEVKGKEKEKEIPPVNDPKPPSRSRYFGGR